MAIEQVIPGGAATQVGNTAMRSGVPQQAVGLTPEQAQQAREQVTPPEPIPVWDQQNPAPQDMRNIEQQSPQIAPKSKWEQYRESRPQYSSVSDEELSYRRWNKYYKDRISLEEYRKVMGVPVETENSTLRDVGRVITQGTLVGSGDEATAALAAGIAKLATLAPGEQAGEDSSFGDIYRNILDTERAELADYREKHPYEALAYEVAGGLGTGSLGALRAVGTTYKAKTAIGAAWGGAYGAGSADGTLEDRAKGAVTGAAIGAVAAPVLAAGGAGVGKVANKVKEVRLEKKLSFQAGRQKFSQRYQDEIYRLRASGVTPNQAIERANKKFGVTKERLMDLEVERGRLFESAGVSKEQAMEKLVAERLTKKIPMNNGFVKEWDRVLTPIYDRIEKHSPMLANQLRRYEAKVYTDVHEWHNQLQPYLDRVRKGLGEQDKAKYGQMLYNGDFEGAKKLLVASTKGDEMFIRREFDQAMNLIGEIGKKMKKAGVGYDESKNYYPRRIRDIEGLKKYLGTEYMDFAESFKPWEKALGDKGAGREGNALNAYLKGTLKTKKKETSLRSRKVKEVNEEIYKYYEDPVAGLDLFLRDAASNIRRRELLGKHVKDDPKTAVELTDDSIDSLIDSFVGLDDKARKEVADLLKARFGAGERGMTGLWSDVRAIAHNSLLGDVVSASTQLADIGVSAWVNGTYNTIRALVGKNKITADDIGIMREMVSELTDPGSLQRVTERIFRLSGFRAVDKLGKNVAINSTLRKYSGMAKSFTGKAKLKQELQPYWGDDTQQLLTDLEQGNVTDLTKQFVFTKLSDMQPISRSEMPEVFLNNPNGRIFYQLGTWTMKQFALYRRTALADLGSKDPIRMARGLKNTIRAGFLIGGANIGSDEMKRFLTNRDSAFTGNESAADLGGKLALNMFKNFTGLSEYSTLGSISVPAGEVGFKLMNKYKAAIEAIGTDEEGDKAYEAFRSTVRQMPLVGKMAYYWLLGGAEDFNKKQKAEQEAARLKQLKN